MAKASDQTLPTPRERMVARLLLTVAQIMCGRSFDGGVDGSISEQITELKTAIGGMQ
jgi:hypothetical protein